MITIVQLKLFLFLALIPRRLETNKNQTPRETSQRVFLSESESRNKILHHHKTYRHALGEEKGKCIKWHASISHIQLGVTQYKMGSIASSMATFRRCIKNFGDKSDVYNYYGELLLDQQKYQEAVEKFETAVEMEKKIVGEQGGGMNVLPLINKALALFQWKQDFSAAEDLCQKALISKFEYYASLIFQPLTSYPSRPRMRHRRCHHGSAPPPAGQGHRCPQVFRARRRALPH